MKKTRKCDGCTACCDGRLLLKVFGHKWVGRPCQFKTDKGCGIYEHRPQNPCKNYRCEWLKDTDFTFPEFLKPDQSGFVMNMMKTKSGIPYLRAVAGRDGYDKEALLWLVDYGNENKINLRFILQGSKYSFGTKDFRKEMNI